jgi:hypothetical protein
MRLETVGCKVAPMRCTVYFGSAGLVLVPDCMRASVEAEHAYGPLAFCGAFETQGLDPDVLARIDDALDSRSFALIDPDLALRLGYDAARALPLPEGFAWRTDDFWESNESITLLCEQEGEHIPVAEVVVDESTRGWYAVTRTHRPWQFRGTRVTLSREAAVQFVSAWATLHASALRAELKHQGEPRPQ